MRPSFRDPSSVAGRSSVSSSTLSTHVVAAIRNRKSEYPKKLQGPETMNVVSPSRRALRGFWFFEPAG